MTPELHAMLFDTDNPRSDGTYPARVYTSGDGYQLQRLQEEAQAEDEAIVITHVTLDQCGARVRRERV